MPSTNQAAKRLAITTERLFLRPVELGDAMAVAALMTPTLAATLCEWRSGMSVTEVTAKIAAHRQAAAAGRRIDWAVFVRPELTMIGWIGLSRSGSALELDCWLGELFRGSGYGREAVAAATARACTEFSTDRIETRTCPVDPEGSKFLKRFGIAVATDRAKPHSKPFTTANAALSNNCRVSARAAKRAIYL
jgi:[ribosomal protein S5]-alanine N-acetyltransferase